MARAVTKQEIRRNPLAEWVGKATRYLLARRSMMLSGLAAVAVVGGAAAGYWWYQERQEGEAGRALALARAALRGERGGAPASLEEATRRYREIVVQRRGTRSAEEALLHLGNAQFDAGKMNEAIASFNEYLTGYPRGRFLILASLGKGYAQEGKGDLRGAAQTLSAALDRDKDDPLAGELYLVLGRIYEGLDKPDEAMRLYGQVVERFGQTRWAQQALRRMGSLKK